MVYAFHHFGNLQVFGGNAVQYGNGWLVDGKFMQMNGNMLNDSYPVMGNIYLNIGGGSGPTPPGGNGEIKFLPNQPTSITGTTTDGDTYTLGPTQILRIQQVISSIAAMPNTNMWVVLVALITGMDESTWRNLSNVNAFPQSANFPNIDGDGDDHNSLGIFQQQSPYWGTPEQCADVTYEGPSFVGGPNGPRAGGSPDGLFDDPGGQAWNTYGTPGEAAQAVQVSAFSDPYDRFVPVADAIMNAMFLGGAVTWPPPS